MTITESSTDPPAMSPAVPTHWLLTNDPQAAPPNARQLLAQYFNMFAVIGIHLEQRSLL